MPDTEDALPPLQPITGPITNHHTPSDPISHEEISQRAYYLWDANGQVPDSGEHYWHLAEQMIRSERARAIAG